MARMIMNTTKAIVKIYLFALQLCVLIGILHLSSKLNPQGQDKRTQYINTTYLCHPVALSNILQNVPKWEKN